VNRVYKIEWPEGSELTVLKGECVGLSKAGGALPTFEEMTASSVPVTYYSSETSLPTVGSTRTYSRGGQYTLGWSVQLRKPDHMSGGCSTRFQTLLGVHSVGEEQMRHEMTCTLIKHSLSQPHEPAQRFPLRIIVSQLLEGQGPELAASNNLHLVKYIGASVSLAARASLVRIWQGEFAVKARHGFLSALAKWRNGCMDSAQLTLRSTLMSMIAELHQLVTAADSSLLYLKSWGLTADHVTNEFRSVFRALALSDTVELSKLFAVASNFLLETPYAANDAVSMSQLSELVSILGQTIDTDFGYVISLSLVHPGADTTCSKVLLQPAACAKTAARKIYFSGS
jgi:hypothetical protein